MTALLKAGRGKRPRKVHPIKMTLVEFGITQTELARAAQMDQVTLGQHLNGQRPMRPEREAWLRHHLERLVAEAAQRNAVLQDPM